MFEPEHLERLVELSDDLICVGSADGYFFRVSPSWTRLLGHDETTLRSQPFLSFLHPEDVAETARQIRRVMRGGRLIRFKNRVRTARGDYRWLRWNVAPAPGSDYAYAIARDITETHEVTAHLEAQTRQLQATERQLAAEITRAREVQEAFFPTASLRRGAIHVAGRCIASHEMSGDFFDWSEYPEGAVSLTVGDVMGKGFSAALLMATTQAVLRAGDVARPRSMDPAERLDQTNATLAGYLGKACRFVTAFRGTLHESGRLRYADAGHGHALIRRRNGTFEALEEAGGLPLGVGIGRPYHAAEALMAPGDVLIVATDGFRDILDGVGVEGWTRHIKASVSDWTDADAIVDDIVLWAESATAGAGASDDLTVLVAVFGERSEGILLQRSVEPQLTALAGADEAVAEALRGLRVSRELLDRFALAFHETLANIVDHARPPEAIRVSLSVRPALGRTNVVAVLRDRGRALPAPADDEDEEWWDSENRSRGRGLEICREVLDRFEYQRIGDENEWRLELAMATPLEASTAVGGSPS